MKRLLKFFKNLIVILLFPALIYSLCVIIGGIIPVNKNVKTQGGPIKIYLLQNGSHTDIVVPVKNEMMDWEKIIKPSHFIASGKKPEYYAFGWGDREFYRTTPYRDDLTFKVAARTILLNTSSALHITRYDQVQTERYIELNISTEQYQKLTRYILKHFQLDKDGQVILLDFTYSEDDVFYASKSSFHAFRTCNTWANNALKFADLKACLWTPIAEVLFWQYS